MSDASTRSNDAATSNDLDASFFDPGLEMVDQSSSEGARSTMTSSSGDRRDVASNCQDSSKNLVACAVVVTVVGDAALDEEETSEETDENLQELIKQRELLLKQLCLNETVDDVVVDVDLVDNVIEADQNMCNESCPSENLCDSVEQQNVKQDVYCVVSSPVSPATVENSVDPVDSVDYASDCAVVKDCDAIFENFSCSSVIYSADEVFQNCQATSANIISSNNNDTADIGVVSNSETIHQQPEHDEDHCDSGPANENGVSDLDAYDILEKDTDDKKKEEEEDKFAVCEKPPIVREKVVLKRRAVENFDILPDGWIELTHCSGIPIYLHKPTRVCTMSRPYFLGPASVRKHHVPVSAIPCLNQTKMKEEEIARKKEIIEQGLKGNGDDPLAKLKQFSGAKVELANDKGRFLDPSDLRNYCQLKFDFKTIKITRFRSWDDHRKYNKRRRLDETLEGDAGCPLNESPAVSPASPDKATDCQIPGRPAFSPGTSLITVPELNRRAKPYGRQFILNPRGKTSIAVLHEYVQKVMRGQVAYEFCETRNAANPYTAKIKILTNQNAKRFESGCSYKDNGKKSRRGSIEKNRSNDDQEPANGEMPSNGTTDGASDSPTAAGSKMKQSHDQQVWVTVGIGLGNSKRNAKAQAAREALKVLLPKLDMSLCSDGLPSANQTAAKPSAIVNGVADKGHAGNSSLGSVDSDLFDMIPITDSRVFDLSTKAGQPAPFIILQEYLKRNAAFRTTKVTMKIERLSHKRHEFTMKIGDGEEADEVRVRCLNKKDGKQKASQYMLQKLHPSQRYWGSLIRDYGYAAQLKLREHKRQKDEVVKLQSSSQTTVPTSSSNANNRFDSENAFGDGLNGVNVGAGSRFHQDLEPNAAILSKLRQEMKKLLTIKSSDLQPTRSIYHNSTKQENAKVKENQK